MNRFLQLLSLSVFTRKWEEVLLGRFERDLWEHTRPSSLLMHRLRLLSARYHALLEKDFLPSFKDRLEKVYIMILWTFLFSRPSPKHDIMHTEWSSVCISSSTKRLSMHNW